MNSVVSEFIVLCVENKHRSSVTTYSHLMIIKQSGQLSWVKSH